MAKQFLLDDKQKSALLNSREAERYAGVTKGYFTYRRSAGMSPNYLRQGHHVFYRKEELDAWTKEKTNFVEVLATHK
jgi:hypothetical protein